MQSTLHCIIYFYEFRGGAAGPDDDEAIAAFFQEVKQEVRSAHVIRKVSGFQGLDVIRLGPDVCL